MTTAIYFRVQPVKAFSKVLAKRFAARLVHTQNAVCRASGLIDLREVYLLQAQGRIGERMESLGFDTWHRRMAFGFGSDLEELFRPTELARWFDLIHGTAVAPHGAGEHDDEALGP